MTNTTTTRRAHVGDQVTGRCVTTHVEYSGTVVAVYPPRYHNHETRYRLTGTGEFYLDGDRIEPVVVL